MKAAVLRTCSEVQIGAQFTNAFTDINIELEPSGIRVNDIFIPYSNVRWIQWAAVTKPRGKVVTRKA